MARALAQLKYAQVSDDGDPHLLDGMHEVYDRILHRGYAMITGGLTGGECWGEIWDTAQIGMSRCAETCAAAYLLRCSTRMLALEGDPVYGDVFERTMYNTFFAAQSHDGCSQKYFIPLNESGQWYKYDTFCCPNNFRRMVFELPQAIFFKADDGIAVNLYNAADLDDDFASVEMTGDYPMSETPELRVTPKTDREFALYFRIPRWCENAEVRIGEEIFTGKPGSFLKIKRQWAPCTLRIFLPMRIRLIEGKAAQSGRAAVLRGPVVYGWNHDPAINADLAEFESDSGFRFEDGSILADVSYCCRGMQHKKMELRPFSHPERIKTYFKTSKKAENDELFQ